ncbi:MAG TPA: hypothetical protein VLW85_13325 [Myxococcales bacterium]|nr:hypothetical protein [Myxococcales bacterium]
MRTALALMLLCGAAFGADSIETRLREALRSATLQLRTAEEQRDALQAKNAQLQKDMEYLQADLKAAKQATARRPAREPEAARKLADEVAANAKLAESVQQCQSAAHDADEAAKARLAELDKQIDALSKRSTSCEAKNARLYQLGKEVLDRFAKESGGPVLLGLDRVEQENAAQDYQDKLLEQRVSQ